MHPKRRDIDVHTVALAQSGDLVAREELVGELGPAVWGMCRRLASVPEDAYQSSWEKIFGSLGRFQIHGQGSLRSWVLTVTRRHLIDMHRRRRHRDNVVRLDEIAVPSELDGLLDQQRRHARLEAAIQRLPESQRRVVVFHHLHGVSLQALAEEEGVALGTIKSRLHRGRARLLTLLEGT